MIKRLCSLILFVACCAVAAGSAQAASKPLVLVLPYQVNAGPELTSLTLELPQIVVEQLQKKDVRVLTMTEARKLLRKDDIQDVDMAMARTLGKKAKADYVVYGVFNQLGQGFTLDSRLVPMDGSAATPLAISRPAVSAVHSAVEELAGQVAGVTHGQAPQAAAAPASVRRDASGVAVVEPMTAQQLAQRPRGNAQTGGLSDVRVVGMRFMDPDVVLMRLTIRKGDNPDDAAVNAELKRIWDMGYFSDVQVTRDANVLTFHVVEKPRIENIIVEGSDAVSKDDILAAMSTRTGTVMSERVMAEDIQKITELYRKEGYYLAKVDYKLDTTNAKGAILSLNVQEGKKLYIREVKVEGLKELKRGDLNEYMALQPRGIFSWFTGKGVLKDEYLERDTNAIAAVGLDKGFLDIQVSAPQVDYREDGIYITIQVNEGPRYAVRDVKFAGDVIADQEKMSEAVQMDDWRKENKYFSVTVMQEDSKRLTAYYGNFGYAFAEVDTKVMKADDGSAQVDVGYLIKKNNKVYIRRVEVEGNTRTRDNVILRELRLADGDQYDGAKLRRTNERLKRLGYFESADSQLVPTSRDDEVDLKIKVKEGNTGSIMAGIGYSTYYDVGVSGSITERNLFGRGYVLGLSGFFSWRRASGTLSFTNPHVYDTKLSVGNDVYYVNDTWDDFTKKTIGDTLRLAYPLGEYTTISTAYRLERYDLSDVAADASKYISDYKGENWTSAVSARITRDTTDSNRPSKGTITRLWGEYGGTFLGGTDNFVKSMFDWQAFYSWRPQHTFHVRGRVGGVFRNSSDPVPVFERFWVGGMDTIRGFSYSDLSPRDGKNKEHVGGDRMGVANVEYIWTFEKDMGLALVPFFDAGFNIDYDTQSDKIQDKMVASTGLELRWRSPMGDLRIAYGIPLTEDYDGEENQGRFEFTMGQNF